MAALLRSDIMGLLVVVVVVDGIASWNARCIEVVTGGKRACLVVTVIC